VGLEALIWDMDGTLFDSSAVVPGAFIAALEASGVHGVSPNAVIAVYGLGPPAVLLEHFLKRRATGEEIDRYHHELEVSARATAVYPGISEVVERLKLRVRLAVFTGASIRAATILLAATGLDEHFAVVVGGDEVRHAKPAPDGVLEACRRLGVAPANAAYVGDARVDLEAARRAGVVAIAAGWGHMYSSAAVADAMAQSPADLEAIVSGSAAD
jgi:HAD superfamily hydrolase (TIGR01549 family)